MGRDIQVRDPDAASRSEPVAGLAVRAPFHVDDAHLQLLRIADETAWNRTPGTLYGWVRAGAGHLDAAHGRTALSAGQFIRIPGDCRRRFEAEDGLLELLAIVDGDATPTATDPPAGRERDKDGDGDEDGGGNGDGDDPAPDVVGPDDLASTVATPNLTRETPFPGDEDVLVLRVRAAGGAAAGWHHHGENVYFGYAVDGPSETEYEDGNVARIERGEAFHVPPGLVHRDTNPTDETHTGIVWLRGGEPWVVNVDR